MQWWSGVVRVWWAGPIFFVGWEEIGEGDTRVIEGMGWVFV